MNAENESDERLLHGYLVRLSGRVWGTVAGLCSGLGLFLATNILVLKGTEEGGPEVGQHLRLLNQYFPGYEVTFVGSLIGFVYAFLVGFAIAWSICKIYNFVARDNSRG